MILKKFDNSLIYGSGQKISSHYVNVLKDKEIGKCCNEIVLLIVKILLK